MLTSNGFCENMSPQMGPLHTNTTAPSALIYAMFPPLLTCGVSLSPPNPCKQTWLSPYFYQCVKFSAINYYMGACKQCKAKGEKEARSNMQWGEWSESKVYWAQYIYGDAIRTPFFTSHIPFLIFSCLIEFIKKDPITELTTNVLLYRCVYTNTIRKVKKKSMHFGTSTIFIYTCFYVLVWHALCVGTWACLLLFKLKIMHMTETCKLGVMLYGQ